VVAIQNQIARAIQNRLPSQNTTGRLWAIQGGGLVAVEVAGGAILYNVRYVQSYAPVEDDVVVLSRDARGLVITGKLGVTLEPNSDIGTSELYLLPRLDMVPVFTGTWQNGKWQTAVDNECRFGSVDGVASMGCAYYGRVLQGSTMYGSDSYFLSIVRLPSPGHIPAKVTVGLLAGQAPTEAGPTVLDTYAGRTLTGPGMGDYAESLSIQFQDWEDRFRSGEAGGLALIHDATETDHLTRVAGTYGCSMNVTGYPAWVL
jgi:hypothetical protein